MSWKLLLVITAGVVVALYLVGPSIRGVLPPGLR
jgi:hypothetical protein